jgi:hypothetical protein
MLWETLGALPWWSFALVGVGGVGFGVLQVSLMRRAMGDGEPKPWLFVVKLLLWAILLVGLGFVSIPLLIFFVILGSSTMIAGIAALSRKTQKKEVK